MPAPLCVVHTESSLGWGGQEIRILTEAAGMQRRGHKVTLICVPDSKIEVEARRRNLAVVALPIGKRAVRTVSLLRQWLREHPADVINTHSSTDSWVAALACRFDCRAPRIVRTRHISARVANDPLTRWLYTRATSHIVTTGERLRERLIKDNAYPSERITSVPTGIDLARFARGERAAARQALGLHQERIVIGVVATMRSWKGHEFLMKAFAMLPDTTALAIIGDGPQRDSLRTLAQQLGIADRVVMPGNQDDVVPWLHAIDIFALPSYANEGVPQSIMQAMACGLPVVSTPVGSIEEIVTSGRTGILVAPKAVEPLRDALLALIDDDGLRRTLGANAQREAQSRFGLEIMLDKMQEVFFSVLAARSIACD